MFLMFDELTSKELLHNNFVDWLADQFNIQIPILRQLPDVCIVELL